MNSKPLWEKRRDRIDDYGASERRVTADLRFVHASESSTDDRSKDRNRGLMSLRPSLQDSSKDAIAFTFRADVLSVEVGDMLGFA